jgi:hypothetical protein
VSTQGHTVPGHFHAPVKDSCYTLTGLRARLDRARDYPVEAVCRCGEVIRCESPRQQGWAGTGRRAGDAPDS